MIYQLIMKPFMVIRRKNKGAVLDNLSYLRQPHFLFSLFPWFLIINDIGIIAK